VLHAQFASHVVLLCLMLAASCIDIDEKIVPDEITVTGTILGLAIAAAVPMSLSPQVAAWPWQLPQEVGEPLANPAGAPAIGMNGKTLWVMPVTVVPQPLPNWLRPQGWSSLTLALGCYWLWCFALAPRIWRGRRGAWFAIQLICRRAWRECTRLPFAGLLVAGTLAIVGCWFVGHKVGGQKHWIGLATSLVGLVASGGIVWAVRLIGTFALRREAMGFGDVTLMMMVGTFLGWQACLIAFFLAPIPGLFVGLLQIVLRRDDVIPYAPYLCMASAAVVVAWAPIWVWAQEMFKVGFLVPLVLVVGLVLFGLLLLCWRLVKTMVFGCDA
jgi:prepilin signal peptidase PulO-like enzyme (type II secretory pathway)